MRHLETASFRYEAFSSFRYEALSNETNLAMLRDCLIQVLDLKLLGMRP